MRRPSVNAQEAIDQLVAAAGLQPPTRVQVPPTVAATATRPGPPEQRRHRPPPSPPETAAAEEVCGLPSLPSLRLMRELAQGARHRSPRVAEYHTEASERVPALCWRRLGVTPSCRTSWRLSGCARVTDGCNHGVTCGFWAQERDAALAECAALRRDKASGPGHRAAPCVRACVCACACVRADRLRSMPL